jgi:hypothetical protein
MHEENTQKKISLLSEPFLFPLFWELIDPPQSPQRIESRPSKMSDKKFSRNRNKSVRRFVHSDNSFTFYGTNVKRYKSISSPEKILSILCPEKSPEKNIF